MSGMDGDSHAAQSLLSFPSSGGIYRPGEPGTISLVAPMDLITLSLTKVMVPSRRPEILTRERLLNLLYDLIDKKLILLSAPAGYGKTSLLIDLAHKIDIQVCWLSLDALDQEPQRFISYFIGALAQSFPRFGSRSLASLKGLASLEGGFENLLVTLVNEIHERIGEHFLIVLDDYQFVDDIPPIRDFVNRFVQLVGENCHLVLSSRTVPALPDMLVMIARNQVGGLSLLELAFQPQEIRTLFQQNYALSLSEADAEEMARLTEGWITGLYLSQWAASETLPDPVRAARTINADVFDYLGQQVLDRQTGEMRTFLLHTSLLDEFNEEMCTVVLGLPGYPATDWKKMLQAVRQNNLFVLPVGQQGKWLRYHHLFREFLQTRLREQDPALAQVILRRLAGVYAQQGEWEKAYAIHQHQGDVDSLLSLVESAGTLLIQNDRLLTLGNWLENIPEPLAQEHPVILSLKGFLALVRGKPESGLPLLSQADLALRRAQDIPNLIVNLVRLSWAQRLLGDYPASLAAADEALQLTSGVETLHSLNAESLRARGLSLFRQGHARQAIEWLEGALASFEQHRERRHAAMVQTELGMVCRAVGDYPAAEKHYHKALLDLRKQGDLTWQATLLNSIGVLHHAQGEYPPAVQAFEQGLDCARQSGYLDTEALLLTSLGDLFAEVGETQAARQTYAQALQIAQRVADRFLVNYLSLASADLARLTGEAGQAFALLAEIHPAIKASGSNYELGLYYLISGRLNMVSGDVQQAIWDLQSAIQLFEQGGLSLEHAWSRLWFAAACKQVGDEDAACLHVRESLALLQPDQPAHSLKMTLLQVLPWIGSLEAHPGIGADFLRLLAKSRKLETQLPAIRGQLRRLSSVVPAPPPHLDIKLLGNAQVRINGKLVTSAQWQTRSVRDLFFFFFLSTKPVTKEQVGAAFWPELSPARLRLRFKNDMYRLRRAVGQETILFADELYHFNRDLDYACDASIFDAELEQASSATDPSGQIVHYQTAIELYHGAYLEDIDASWAWLEREHKQKQYLAALLHLSRLLLQAGRMDEALHTSQQALNQDACLEEAHQLVMQVHAAMKDKSSITRQYQLCKKILARELGVPPSAETEQVYRQLIA